MRTPGRPRLETAALAAPASDTPPPDPWYRHYASHVALRRGPAAPISPTLRSDRHAQLDFEREASWYLERIHAGRPPEIRRIIERLSEAILLSADVRSVSLIPAFAGEPQIARALATGGGQADHRFVVLVNAAAAQCSRREFAAHVDRLRAQLDELGPEAAARVVLVAEHFEQAMPVRMVRGLLTDALVIAARRHQIVDPIVIYGDADQLAAADAYVPRVRRHFADAPLLDMVAGPVLFGGDPQGASLLPAGARLPELFLGDRFMQATQAARRAGEGVPPHFITQGANVAFRLAALCAGGGLDYALWEDAQIGWWTSAMRLDDGAPAAYQPAHHRFDEELHVSTDPRRALRAIFAGCTADEAWDFEPYDTAPITADFEIQHAQYLGNHALLQLDDVRRAGRSSPVAIDKLQQRVLFNFFRPLHRTNPVWTTAVAARFGLALTAHGSSPGDERFEISWDRSRVLADLIAWAR